MAQQTILGGDSVKDALLTKVNNNDDDAYVTVAEVIAARDGESSLLVKEQAQDTAIAALTAASGVKVSTDDTTIGYLDGKLLEGDGITFAVGSPAGDETLTISMDIVGDTTPELGGDLDCNDKQFLESSYTQIADASLGTGTHTFDYTAGDMQQLTATGDITLATSGFVSGAVCGIIIDAVNWGAHTITHPAAWLFAGGAAPSYTAAGTDRLKLIKDKDDIYTLSVTEADIKAV